MAVLCQMIVYIHTVLWDSTKSYNNVTQADHIVVWQFYLFIMSYDCNCDIIRSHTELFCQYTKSYNDVRLAYHIVCGSIMYLCHMIVTVG